MSICCGDLCIQEDGRPWIFEFLAADQGSVPLLTLRTAAVVDLALYVVRISVADRRWRAEETLD